MMHYTGIVADSTELAALAIDGPQPVWLILNKAREQVFTGEIVFETDPEVHAYLDHGIVYYAERVTDVPLGRRLLDAGVLDMIQLERGTVRVGDIEHLGRLFDRNPSVDRDAVVVLAETSTEQLITELANRAITTVRFTAYRHHPSGVHRWFVAPLDLAVGKRPVGTMAQLDVSVLDHLPGLPLGSAAEELTIEWDDDIVGAIDRQFNVDEDDSHAVADNDGNTMIDVEMLLFDDPHTQEAPGVAELEVEDFERSLDLAEHADDLDEFDSATPYDVDEAMNEMVDVEMVDFEFVDVEMVDVEVVEEVDEFTVVWPDVSEEPATEPASFGDEYHLNDVDVAPAFTQTDDGNIQFVMPPLMLSDASILADADVPDDVADAVLRAIAAIESATVPTHSSNVEGTEVAELSGSLDVTPGLAPPTLDTSVEVLYGQLNADGVSAGEDVGASPAGGTEDDSGDRNSALRRLIGSLRRKDH